MDRICSNLPTLLLPLLLIPGCSISTHSDPGQLPAEELTSALSPPLSPPPSPSHHGLDRNVADSAPSPTVELPYPDRQSPFRLDAELRAHPLESSSSQASHSPRLCGFVDVNGLAAVVMLDGRTEILRPGDQLQKMTLVNIKPPLAEFAKGNRRWTTSLMEDNGRIDAEASEE